MRPNRGEGAPAQLGSYRPISNLSFASKLLERSIASQISAFFNQNSLFPPLQSAYRPRHSTETALLKIINNAVMAADQGMVRLVILLDYSAAFDTVDHATMCCAHLYFYSNVNME